MALPKIKIFAPLSNYNEINPLIKYGVDDFFFGFNFNGSIDDTNSFNLRPFREANFDSKEVLICALKKIKKLNKGRYLCLNNDFYTDSQLTIILDMLKKVNQWLSGIIISDFLLISMLKKFYPDLEFVASTKAKICNSEAVRFYLKFGVDKITLSIALTMDEIKKIISLNPGVEFKVFIKNEMCRNINALCGITHNCFEKDMAGSVFCKYPRSCVALIKKIKKPAKKKIEAYFNEIAVDYECGVCKMKDFFEMGITTFKMAGRNVPIDRNIRDMYFIAMARDLIKLKVKKFKKNVKQLYRKIYGFDCEQRCLYEN